MGWAVIYLEGKFFDMEIFFTEAPAIRYKDRLAARGLATWLVKLEGNGYEVE